MEQVFTNLLANALKFTPRGGRIDVAAEERGADILVTVADSGVGIPPEHLDRVFDRFWGSHAGRLSRGRTGWA
jgi:signal transduction histidine kinase